MNPTTNQHLSPPAPEILLPPTQLSAPILDAYEFTTAENRVVQRLFSGMFATAFVYGILGALLLLASAAKPVLFPPGGLLVALAILTAQAGISFRAIVTTKGRDMRHLMRGLRVLYLLYTLQAWMIALSILVGLFLMQNAS